MDNIIGFLMNPYLQGILIMLIVAGIYFEMQSPGLGFPIIVAITAAVTYFAPLYLEGLAEHWEILLFIVGVGLIAVELFAIPGFGVTGISGILLVIASLTLSMVDNVTFTTDSGSFLPLFKALVFVLLSILISLVASIFIGVKLMSVAPFQFLVLDTVQNPEEGFVNLENSISSLVGKMGTAHTVLRPSGKVEIENEIYDAKSEYGFIEKGEKVKVVRHEASQIYVVKA
jgi:membrane-bound serine protease (ClpP class)